MAGTIPTLVRLRDCDLQLADADEDVRGRTVTDADGEDLGEVEDLLIDEDGRRARMLVVEHGGLLGIGASHSYLPVDAVTSVEADRVRVNRSRDEIGAAPAYDPDLVERSAQTEYYERLYGYYGFGPFWMHGYVAPGFPFGLRR